MREKVKFEQDKQKKKKGCIQTKEKASYLEWFVIRLIIKSYS